MAAEKTDFAFEVTLFFWKILTYGYIPHILITICFIVLVFSIVFLLGNAKIFKFLINDRLKFAKQYIFTFIHHKFYFAKNFVSIFWENINKPKLIYILITIGVIVGISIYLFTRQ